jgi:small-conductance mechanosensitive channel
MWLMDEPLPEVSRSDLVDTAIAFGIFFAALILAWFLAVLIPRLIRRMMRSDGSSPLDALVDAVRRPIFWLILVQGLFLALRHPAYMREHLELIDRLWIGTVVVAVIAGIIRANTHWFAWYQQRSEAGQLPGRIEPRVLSMIRRAANVVVVVVGGLLLLDVLGLEITPLIAGLGIGGLAVGLALQPVLASLFASSSMMSDASLKVGDFVEVEAGPVGTVEHIGWRATRIRSFDNNIVLIPNSKLADSTFTNYSTTTFQADARLIFGVAYEEDLQQVEDVVIDELTMLRDEFEGAVPSYEPMLRFQEFGDSNIDVLVKLRANTWVDSFMLRHLMVKRIHARLGREGITINYPARRLFMHGDDVSGLDRLFGLADAPPTEDPAAAKPPSISREGEQADSPT